VGEQRVWSFDAAPESIVLLSLEARIAWENLAGSAQILELNINEAPVTDEALINKPIMLTYVDGRSWSYYSPAGPGLPPYWMLFYSPDYESNNVRGSKYQVLEGQAYLYMFDISPLILVGQVNQVTLRNRGELFRDAQNQPIPLAVRQVKLLKQSRE
jgi:hypothetical protein